MFGKGPKAMGQRMIQYHSCTRGGIAIPIYHYLFSTGSRMNAIPAA